MASKQKATVEGVGSHLLCFRTLSVLFCTLFCTCMRMRPCVCFCCSSPLPVPGTIVVSENDEKPRKQ